MAQRRYKAPTRSRSSVAQTVRLKYKNKDDRINVYLTSVNGTRKDQYISYFLPTMKDHDLMIVDHFDSEDAQYDTNTIRGNTSKSCKIIKF